MCGTALVTSDGSLGQHLINKSSWYPCGFSRNVTLIARRMPANPRCGVCRGEHAAIDDDSCPSAQLAFCEAPPLRTSLTLDVPRTAMFVEAVANWLWLCEPPLRPPRATTSHEATCTWSHGHMLTQALMRNRSRRPWNNYASANCADGCGAL